MKTTVGNVTIYHPSKAKDQRWIVVYRFAGKRERKKFPSLAAATEFAEAQNERIINGEVAGHNLSAADAATTARWLEVLLPLGKPLAVVFSEYFDAQKILGPVSVVDAAKDYAQRRSIGTKSVQVAVEEFLVVKANQSRAGRSGLDSDYLRLMGMRLGKFSEAFKCNLDAVTSADVAAWLKSIGGALRTRNNYLNDVRNLFKHAKKHHWLTKEFDELELVDLPKAGPGKIQPFTPDELTMMLAHAQAHAPKWLPYLAIRAFSGVRAEEVGRLAEHHFHIDLITMDEDVTKTGIRRFVPILPALKKWLEKYPVKNGSIVPYVNNNTMGAKLTEFVRAAGVRPRHNGLRDAYVSFRMVMPEIGGNAEMVSQETGHSPAMLRRSYREIRLPDGRVITPSVAKEWFSVSPTPQKIVRLQG